MKTNLRILLAGGGRIGLRTAQLLADRGHDVVLIDRDPERCEQISDEYVATVIRGDATEREILEQAEPGKADALAALTPDAGYNRDICRLALEINGDLHTVARSDEGPSEQLEGLVDEVIYPEHLGAIGAANALLGTSVRALENATGVLQILAVEISGDAPVAGKKLEEVSLPEGCLVISDADADRLADPEMELEAGKTFLVAAEPRVVEEVQRLLRG